MGDTIAFTRISRSILGKFLDEYTLKQLNYIPHGFNNNLIWNIAHVVVVQQMLVYNLSSLPMMVSQQMIDRYKPGTKPEHDVTQQEVDEIRALLKTTIDQTEKDFALDLFQQYKDYKTATGFHLQSAYDAMAFNGYHEGMHRGMMMAIKKFV